MPKETHLEFKVGIFVILAFIAGTLFIFSVGDFSIFEEGYTIRAIFGFVSGVKKSSPVRFAGVDVGVVKNVDIFYDREESMTKVELELWLRKGMQVPKDSIVMINQLGLFGEKYVEILPGMDTKEFLIAGEFVKGKDPIIQEKIAEQIVDVTMSLQEGVDGINAIVNDQGNKESFKQALSRINGLTESLDNILNQVESGQGMLGRIFYDDRIYDDLEALTSDLRANPWKLLYRSEKK